MLPLFRSRRRQAAMILMMLGIAVTGWLIFRPPRVHRVTLAAHGFVPATTLIQPGDIVSFTVQRGEFWPATNLHPGHTLYPGFDARRPITASASYEFRFGERGAWRYHDHLHPAYEGTIVVRPVWPLSWYYAVRDSVAGRIFPGQPDGCAAGDARCWDQTLRTVLRTRGITAAMAVLHREHGQPEFQRICHDLAHQLGHEAALRLDFPGGTGGVTDLRICDYGFFHGFMELLLAAGHAPDQAASLCDGLERSGSDTRDMLGSCYHGIGHGGVLLHESTAADPWSLAGPGIAVCEQVTTDDFKRQNCVSGVIDGIATGYTSGRFGMNDTFRTDPYAVCRTVAAVYRDACILSLNGLVMYGSDWNITTAVRTASGIDSGVRDRAIHNLAAMIVRDRPPASYADGLRPCAEVPASVRAACMAGVREGYMIRYVTGSGIADDALAACAGAEGSERELCYMEIAEQIGWLGQLSAGYCQQLPEQYRSACHGTLETSR